MSSGNFKMWIFQKCPSESKHDTQVKYNIVDYDIIIEHLL